MAIWRFEEPMKEAARRQEARQSRWRCVVVMGAGILRNVAPS